MQIAPFSRTSLEMTLSRPAADNLPKAASPGDEETREAFQSFVGQTMFGQMLAAMRKTVGKPAYFHGGRAEEVFRQQLDQVLAEKLSSATADQFAEPMYELFTIGRS